MLYLALRQSTGEPLLTFDNQYLTELESATADRLKLNPNTSLLDLLNKPSFGVDDYIEKPVGIDCGSAYYILNDILS